MEHEHSFMTNEYENQMDVSHQISTRVSIPFRMLHETNLISFRRVSLEMI